MANMQLGKGLTSKETETLVEIITILKKHPHPYMEDILELLKHWELKKDGR